MKNEALLRRMMQQYHIEDHFTDLDSYMHGFRLVSFPKHTFLYSRPEHRKYAYFLVSGRLCVYATAEGGQQMLVRHCDSFIFLGDMELLGYEEPSNMIETTTACMFVALDVVLLRERLLEDTRFLRFLSASLAEKINYFARSQFHKQTISARQKVIAYVLEVGGELGYFKKNLRKTAERENFFLAYHHRQPEWGPNFFSAYSPMGSSLLNNQGIPGVGGRDMFGVNWLVTPDTGYQAIPDPHEHILEDISDWRDIVHFPDLDAMDWEAAAVRDLAHVDRENKVVACFGMEGNFNRLQSLMGICEAMIAMVEEPEEVYAFFKAHTEFKMKTIEKIAKYYKPDIYVNGDDVCSSDGPFVSREMYNELIKPFEIMLGQKAVSEGMIVEHHVCGRAEDLVPDIIETGATIWQMAQSMNDVEKVKEQYGDRLLIHGGWDSFGPHNYEDCTEEQVRAEVRRCIDTYGKGGNYALFAVVMGDSEDEKIQKRRFWVDDECHKYRPWKQ